MQIASYLITSKPNESITVRHVMVIIWDQSITNFNSNYMNKNEYRLERINICYSHEVYWEQLLFKSNYIHIYDYQSWNLKITKTEVVLNKK